jgi:hypothetical protein
MFTTPAGGENLGLCQSWTLDNSTELWINAVELDQDEASHHSNWLFVPDDKYPGPDGVWNCGDRHYEELGAALAGGVLYAQSTQATHEVQKFPDGAAVRLPPYSRIIGDVHLLNASNQPVTGHARLMIYPLPAAQVKVKLAPFHLGFEALDVPPHALSRSLATCELDSQFQVVLNHSLDAQVYFILPHYHALGRHFFVQHHGGARDGQPLFDAIGASGDARGRAYDPPVDLAGDDGLTFGCDFDNESDATVSWGFGDQEMCELLGFASSEVGWNALVGDVHAVDNVPAGMPTFTGPCNALLFKIHLDSPGGPPPDGGT